MNRTLNLVDHLLYEGMSLLRAGDVGEGLDRLREAHELESNDLEILESLANGLTDAGFVEEADDLLRTAMFRQSGDRRFVELRRRHQFRILADEQAGPPRAREEAAPISSRQSDLPHRRPRTSIRPAQRQPPPSQKAVAVTIASWRRVSKLGDFALWIDKEELNHRDTARPNRNDEA
jgi:hypothetical protein